jgi:shikimate dehydrogenase
MEFYGIIGEKLSHSLSPRIHKRVFELLGIEGAYKLFEIPNDKTDKVIDSLKLLKIKGVNVTIPYKTTLINQLDKISNEAKAIGAINTILIENGEAKGYNTDYYGFGSMLEINNIQIEDKIAVVLGAGGAAKAITTYLLDNKVKSLYLVTRNKATQSEIDGRIKLIDYQELKEIKGDMLINTTPVGMYPNVGKSPVDEDIISNFEVLVDIIYNPRVTEFLRLGQKLGKITCGGLYMLVGQAIKSQEIWQNIKIDNSITTKIYNELQNEFN